MHCEKKKQPNMFLLFSDERARVNAVAILALTDAKHVFTANAGERTKRILASKHSTDYRRPWTRNNKKINIIISVSIQHNNIIRSNDTMDNKWKKKKRNETIIYNTYARRNVRTTKRDWNDFGNSIPAARVGAIHRRHAIIYRLLIRTHIHTHTHEMTAERWWPL